jgi:hypothetical protein
MVKSFLVNTYTEKFFSYFTAKSFSSPLFLFLRFRLDCLLGLLLRLNVLIEIHYNFCAVVAADVSRGTAIYEPRAAFMFHARQHFHRLSFGFSFCLLNNTTIA